MANATFKLGDTVEWRTDHPLRGTVTRIDANHVTFAVKGDTAPAEMRFDDGDLVAVLASHLVKLA